MAASALGAEDAAGQSSEGCFPWWSSDSRWRNKGNGKQSPHFLSVVLTLKRGKVGDGDEKIVIG